MADSPKVSQGIACDNTHTKGEYLYGWLEDCLERLEGKDAYRGFQERYYGTPEYYTLVASLAA
jgi:hypothetical protein